MTNPWGGITTGPGGPVHARGAPAVFGDNRDPSDSGDAVVGVSDEGTGVYGYSPHGPRGVYGQADADTAAGVMGFHPSHGPGVHGESVYADGVVGKASGDGSGVVGTASGNGSGVQAAHTKGGPAIYATSDGYAIYAKSAGGDAVLVESGTDGGGVYVKGVRYGVTALANGDGSVGVNAASFGDTGIGVSGSADAGTGVAGATQGGVGVSGASSLDTGIGVRGSADAGTGVAGEATSRFGTGVAARNTGDGYALSVDGRAQFSRAGATLVQASASKPVSVVTVGVPGGPLGGDSFVLATMQGQVGVGVQCVDHQSAGTSFDIHLTGPATQTFVIGWLIVA